MIIHVLFLRDNHLVMFILIQMSVVFTLHQVMPLRRLIRPTLHQVSVSDPPQCAAVVAGCPELRRQLAASVGLACRQVSSSWADPAATVDNNTIFSSHLLPQQCYSRELPSSVNVHVNSQSPTASIQRVSAVFSVNTQQSSMFSYYTTEMTETYRLGASKSFLHP